MRRDVSRPLDTFETWLLRRVAQAVKAGEVPAGLLAELHAACEAVRERPREESHNAAIRHIADLTEVPGEGAAKALAAIEAQPTIRRTCYRPDIYLL